MAMFAERFKKPRNPRASNPCPGACRPVMDAEAAVLSATLLDSDAFESCARNLLPEHFYADANRRDLRGGARLQSTSRP